MDNYAAQSWHVYDQHLDVVSSRLKSSAWAKYFERNYGPLLAEAPSGKVLDLGCGQGQFLEWVLSSGHREACGIDLSEPNVEACRQRGLPVQHADALEFLASRREQYACVVMNDVLEHFNKEALALLLSSVRNALVEEGRIVVKVPNSAHPIVGPRGRWIDLTHEVGFTEESLRQVLVAAGFRQITVRGPDIYCIANPFVNLGARLFAGIVNGGLRLLFRLYGAKSTTIFAKNLLATGVK